METEVVEVADARRPGANALDIADGLAVLIIETYPHSHEQVTALTRLRECVMWLRECEK